MGQRALEGFHPTVRDWFARRFERPSDPQVEGWPRIAEGRHTLIAAPTGSGKTLAAFLWAIDSLLRGGDALPDETRVLYVSPLKALGSDVRKNLTGPLAELAEGDPAFPELRVQVRSGDTPPRERQAMLRRPPHILVTTPESLYILLTSAGGRDLLATVRTAIVDEIHAIAGDKRGAHLALSLERLDALVEAQGGALQRIGLSATQKPLESTGRLLVGADRDCTLVDVGHRRELDLALELPESPLATVCSHETWDEILDRVAALIDEHRTTLVFVNTRKLAERVAARLTERMDPETVTSHHGSLSRERRLDAEERLKEGRLRALVATASLELGIDVGDVDLVVQLGVPASIALLLQRVGRSGHALGRTPKGRLFPLTQDELVCAAALVDAVRRGELDRTPQPGCPLDILLQQVVAACAVESWDERELYDRLRRAWPYRELTRQQFDDVVALHTGGRHALLHRDPVTGKLRGTKRARIPALTSGGAIPDNGEYRVVLEPEATYIGSVDEDFAIEASGGDVFQLGNASWAILRVEPGVVRVADARGAPPSLPFWFGEAPARTEELSAAIARVRERGLDRRWSMDTLGLPEAAATQLADYLDEGVRLLGAMPTTDRVVLERFFDESGGMQLVLHAPFGGRINRAWGLALRKRFCRGFGFELQAAANEEAIVLSLGPMHSFSLDEVFEYLHPNTARDVLVQALLPGPQFGTRWRWNVTRALLLPRTRGGKRVPTPLLRMRADDLLAAAFPAVLACGENLPAGDLPIPEDQPLVAQTIEDCLTEAMDVDGFLNVLRRLRDGSLKTVAIDTPAPSAFARGVLNAAPYAFLDDAPLEERRTQAVLSRRVLDPRTADELGALDAAAVERVRAEAWPQAEDAEELHEALGWMGYLTAGEARKHGWSDWLAELEAAGRVEDDGGRYHAVGSDRTPKQVLFGRLEALGPVDASRLDENDRRLLAELETDGAVLRCRIGAADAWCERRLLARIQRYTLERLRAEIEPLSAAALWRFLAAWQYAAPGRQLDGPRGVAEVARQLSGFEIPAAAWEESVLPARVARYRPEWLDQVTLSGEVVWLRLWGASSTALRSTPLSLVLREDLDSWLALAEAESDAPLSTHAHLVAQQLAQRGPSFANDLQRACGLLREHFEEGLGELIARGRVGCDSFGGLRRLITPAARRRRARSRVPFAPAGRWAPFDRNAEPLDAETRAAFALRVLLDRYGIIFRRLLTRERLPVPWRELVRACRRMELRGKLRGGRFVQRFAGEQYARPEAVALMRRLRRQRRKKEEAEVPPLEVAAADPLNLEGILTPADRVPAGSRTQVRLP